MANGIFFRRALNALKKRRKTKRNAKSEWNEWRKAVEKRNEAERMAGRERDEKVSSGCVRNECVIIIILTKPGF